MPVLDVPALTRCFWPVGPDRTLQPPFLAASSFAFYYLSIFAVMNLSMTDLERDIIREILNIGLARAADSSPSLPRNGCCSRCPTWIC